MTQSGESINTAFQLPPSAASNLVNLTALCCFLVVFVLLNRIENLTPQMATFFLFCSVVVPQVFLDIFYKRVYKRPSSGLDFSRENCVGWQRALVKLLGLYMTLAVIAFIYWVLPEYHGDFYNPFYDMLRIVFPYFVLFAFPYFIFIDRFMLEPKDGYWHFGVLLLGRFNQVDKAALIQYALAWLVKGFFIPLMYVFFINSTTYFINIDYSQIFSSVANFYAFTFEFSYLIDLVFGFMGYIITVRLLDTHIRSTEPTLKGWLFAIVCYEPIWSSVSFVYFAYNSDSIEWGSWLQDQPVLYAIWATMIIALLLIYALSTVAFGMRFSNLTHRGILTNGPYRYCKHPGYVSKNLSWWLISVPFVVESSAFEAMRNCIMLLGVNFIYYMRAKTEEQHLSWDPVYQQYALAMNEKSIFSGLAKLLPFLRYKKPVQPHPLERLKHSASAE